MSNPIIHMSLKLECKGLSKNLVGTTEKGYGPPTGKYLLLVFLVYNFNYFGINWNRGVSNCTASFHNFIRGLRRIYLKVLKNSVGKPSCTIEFFIFSSSIDLESSSFEISCSKHAAYWGWIVLLLHYAQCVQARSKDHLTTTSSSCTKIKKITRWLSQDNLT